MAGALALSLAPTGAGAATAKPRPTARASQAGYVVTFCGLPPSGMAIRAGDRDSATEKGRVYNGDKGHVYATWMEEPSISFPWATGYGRLGSGAVVHGYFKMTYTCI